MEREFCPKSLQDSKSLERESACSPKENLPRAGWSNLRGVRDRATKQKSRLQQSCSGLGSAITSRGIGGVDSTGSTRKPPSGSSDSVMVAAHCEHNQKCAVSRCGVSSSWLELSSTAEIEIEVISN